jgi:hypothetical protein
VACPAGRGDDGSGSADVAKAAGLQHEQGVGPNAI